ncbi:hypothetical protein RCZ16_14590 [Capnocytophaga catalasegens]|uniref:Uncharacterized protein n=2 Tax=Capnocytophaga catalasegens TaxID=1004260 RepID=A0ABQ4VNL9_9FLAO|nr:hypothetical protein RCZ03_18480 [Capnocytophaga catalasegens]GJM53142.1 hypothetical protein RCZ16_14590 [Capnocytophaga catalasegens]
MLNASDNAIKEVTFVNIVLNDLNLSNNQLTKLDVAACTNFIGGYAKFNAQNNPSLTCIRVSNAQLGSIKNYKNNWLKDNTANFDTSCN